MPHNFSVLQLTRGSPRTGTKGSFRSRSVPVLPFSTVGTPAIGCPSITVSSNSVEAVAAICREGVHTNERERRNEDREREGDDEARGHEIRRLSNVRFD